MPKSIGIKKRIMVLSSLLLQFMSGHAGFEFVPAK